MGKILARLQQSEVWCLHKEVARITVKPHRTLEEIYTIMIHYGDYFDRMNEFKYFLLEKGGIQAHLPEKH